MVRVEWVTKGQVVWDAYFPPEAGAETADALRRVLTQADGQVNVVQVDTVPAGAEIHDRTAPVAVWFDAFVAPDLAVKRRVEVGGSVQDAPAGPVEVRPRSGGHGFFIKGRDEIAVRAAYERLRSPAQA